MDITAEPVFDGVCDLGEGPLWSQRDRALYWVDVTGRTVWRHDIGTGKTVSHSVSGMPGSIAPRESGGIIAAFRTGLALVDLDTGEESKLPAPIDFGIERFNDGKCDRRGRFFAGTMDKTIAAPIGGLYRVDPDLTVTKVAGDIQLSNGLAWSPDNKTLYHNESRPGYVYAYDYDIETGTVQNRRIHIDFAAASRHPDGSTIDAEGCLWIAEVGDWSIGRYDPDGKRMGGIKVPTQRVTSVMFGGDDLSTLYITSMRYNLSPEQLSGQPLAGRVFAAQPGVKGIPEIDFAG